MSWRAILGVCAGLLLPLPLILLLGSLLRPDWEEPGPEGVRVSPVLSTEERLRLSTYRRDCGLSSECEPPLGCLMEARVRRQYCTDSQCATDAQCPEGQVCQLLATSGDGPRVRFCVPVGVRQEGEHCIELPEAKESACAPGLLCGGRHGWCARPCRRGDAAGCPDGFFCTETLPQPLCLPTCEARGCSEGQHCIQFSEGSSACAQVYGPHCQQAPCPEGRECEVGQSSTRPGKVWMECIERCGEGFPACSAGLVCDGWQCRAPCNPQEPACIAGYVCKQHRPDRPWVCQPDW
jgi:hypothetical protein